MPVEIDDAELERRLFTPAGFDQAPTRAMPDWSNVHAERRRRGVTLLLLCEEYRAKHRDGYGYSRLRGEPVLFTPSIAPHPPPLFPSPVWSTWPQRRSRSPQARRSRPP